MTSGAADPALADLVALVDRDDTVRAKVAIHTGGLVYSGNLVSELVYRTATVERVSREDPESALAHFHDDRMRAMGHRLPGVKAAPPAVLNLVDEHGGMLWRFRLDAVIGWTLLGFRKVEGRPAE
ncbi:hypothetical protein ACFV5G_19495 [Streptomyces sp. NPDC059766]|uniref:hypothetical protein n=1 Tax=Streptomyces sp. NPDC059766 TaxID=3346940 RepID=UPI0036541447